jgi:signal transduction histidine kinase
VWAIVSVGARATTDAGQPVTEWLRRHWPRLRLRTLLFGIFVFVAGLPGLSAVFLRVYENTLVRQTEGELIAQGAAIAAAAGSRFDAVPKPLGGEAATYSTASSIASRSVVPNNGYYRPEPPRIDLNQAVIFGPRPGPIAAAVTASAADLAMASRVEPIIAQTGRTTLAAIILVDGRGTILTGVWKGLSYANVAEVRRALTGKAATRLRYFGGYQARYSFEWLSRAASVRVHHVRPIIVNGKVVGAVILSRSSRALFRGMYEDRGKILLGFLLILATLILLTILLHRTIAKPIEALSAATRGVSAGQGMIPEAPATAALEIRALYQDFRDMTQVIARRSRYLRDFAAAVSHEFKTPLAGIRGGIELIEDHHGSMSAKERRQFLGNISADADRLSALVGRLMDLARADMARPEADAATDVGLVLSRVADAMRCSGFTVTINQQPSLPKIAVPQPTLETVLMGLFDNSRQAGASAVAVSAAVADDQVLLSVRDNGPGISGADRERLFEPFFTTRRAEGGTGLGLPIARSLIEACNGVIDLLNTESGAAFELRLPIAAYGL